MRIRSMLYHRKPLFWLFMGLITVAIALCTWLLTRPPAQNAGNQEDSDPSSPLTIVSGQNEIQVPGYLKWYENEKDGVSGDGVYISPGDIGDMDSIILDPDREGPRPFTTYIRGEEAYGQYRLYDEDAKEIPRDFPSGLAPQTYLFHGCEPGRYIVSFETSFDIGDCIYGYQYFFGVIVSKEDKVVTAPMQKHQDDTITITLYQDGEYVRGVTISDPGQEQIVMDAIFNYLIKSAAWPAVDIDTMEKRIDIYIAEEDARYYVFDLEGRHCMQSGRDGRYAVISDEVYAPLYELAAGY